MERLSVESRHVKSLGYDAESQTLEVEFLNGAIYDYAPVSQEQFDAFSLPDVSVGRLLNAIKADAAIACVKKEAEE